MLEINRKITITADYIHITYVRSRGPGGQNVNKVNTQAQLAFDLDACDALSNAAKKRLRDIAGTRVNSQGKLLIRSDRFRRQKRKRQECLDRLRRMIEKALVPPIKRIGTKPTAASKRKRLADKRRRGLAKSQRGKVQLEQ